MVVNLRDKLLPIGQVRVLYDSCRKVEDYYRRNPPDESDLDQVSRFGIMYSNLSYALASMGRRSEAEQCARTALDISRKVMTEDSPVWLQADLAVDLERMGDMRKAAGDRQGRWTTSARASTCGGNWWPSPRTRPNCNFI